MTAISFLEKLVNKWDEEQFCNDCWAFSVPMSMDRMNAYIPEQGKECCYTMFVTSHVLTPAIEFLRDGRTRHLYCDEILTLYIVKGTNMGVNAYNEEPGHDINESLYRLIWEPLADCLGCGTELTVCETWAKYSMTSWTMEATNTLINDANYVGYRCTLKLRKRV